MKYVEIAQEFNGEQSVKEKAESAGKMLSIKLDAKIAVLKAKIAEKEAEVKELEEEAEARKGVITKDIEKYVTGYLNAKDKVDGAQEELDELKDLMKDLKELAKLF